MADLDLWELPNEDAYTQHMDARQAERAPGIGPSGVHDCFRQQAYRYLGVEPSNNRSTEAANLGTLLHLGWSALIAANYAPAEREADVTIDIPGLPRPGSADDVDWLHAVVTDLKTAKDRVWQSWLNKGGPYEKFWDQVELYAYGLHLIHGREWTLRIIAINRETGAKQEYERAADPERGAMLAEKIRDRHQVLILSMANVATSNGEVSAEDEVTRYPREGKGPGMGMPCDYCPWMDACWGTPPEGSPLTPQSFSVDGDATAVGEFAREYIEARTIASKYYGMRDEAGAFLRGLDGTYTDANGVSYRVRMTGGYEKDEPDCEGMIEVLVSMGRKPIFKRVTTPLRLDVRVAKRPAK